jgi:hypothetical protein
MVVQSAFVRTSSTAMVRARVEGGSEGVRNGMEACTIVVVVAKRRIYVPLIEVCNERCGDVGYGISWFCCCVPKHLNVLIRGYHDWSTPAARSYDGLDS